MRDLKELNWRSRGPKLPPTVLDAATLRIGAPLPEPYRQFLSQMDGGKVGRGGFRAESRDWRIAGFYCFADAAALMEKLKKGGRIPPNYLPVAYTDESKQLDSPLIYLELNGKGRVYLKGSPKTKWEDAGAVSEVAGNYGAWVDSLGDPAPEPIAPPPPEPAAEAPPPPAPKPAATTAAPRPAAAPKAAAPTNGASKKAPPPAPKAKVAPMKKKAGGAPAKKAPAKKKTAPKAAGRAKKPAKKVPAKAGRGRR